MRLYYMASLLYFEGLVDRRDDENSTCGRLALDGHPLSAIPRPNAVRCCFAREGKIEAVRKAGSRCYSVSPRKRLRFTAAVHSMSRRTLAASFPRCFKAISSVRLSARSSLGLSARLVARCVGLA
jgi:hypothetical protein